MPNDGGPAFPKTVDGARPQQDGMSLRDWFAGMALQGFSNNYLAMEKAIDEWPIENGAQTKSVTEFIAELAYEVSDAMLAERDKPTERTHAKKAPELPGMERKSIKAIESAAEEYAELRDKRMAALEKEVVAKAKLIDVMHKHECTIYKFDDKVVELSSKEKVKVKKAGSDSEDDEGGDE